MVLRFHLMFSFRPIVPEATSHEGDSYDRMICAASFGFVSMDWMRRQKCVTAYEICITKENMDAHASRKL